MKISKIAVAALFAAGFIALPAGMTMADTRQNEDPIIIQCLHEYSEETGYDCIDTTPEDEISIYPPVEEEVTPVPEEGDVDVKPQPVIDCMEGYTAVYSEDGYSASCEEDAVAYTTEDGDVDVKPIDSCWVTEDGIDICARGAMVPMPATLDDTPVETPDCSVTTDEQGTSSEVCLKAVPYGATSEEDDSVAYLEDGPVDDELMFQSGVTKTLATPADPTVSNAVAIFAVLVGALWALVIVMNRRKATK